MCGEANANNAGISCCICMAARIPPMPPVVAVTMPMAFRENSVLLYESTMFFRAGVYVPLYSGVTNRNASDWCRMPPSSSITGDGCG